MIFTSVTWHLYHGLPRSPASTNGTGNRKSAMTMGSEVGRSAFTSDCYLRLDRRIKVIVSFQQFLKLLKFCCGTTGNLIQNSRRGVFFWGGGGGLTRKSPGLFRHGWNFVLNTKYSKTILCWCVVRLHDHFQYVANYWLNTALYEVDKIVDKIK
jgi:hypothetical protein